jgi:hypothetical protein
VLLSPNPEGSMDARIADFGLHAAAPKRPAKHVIGNIRWAHVGTRGKEQDVLVIDRARLYEANTPDQK